MNDVAEQGVAIPRATTRRSRRISIIWVIPIVAVAIGAWLAWDTWSKEGPTIRISFDSGEGLQAGQSQLKYKDIVFGTVKSLELSPDHTRVIVTVKTTHQAEPLLTDRTIFWVVKPRFLPATSPVSRRCCQGAISACRRGRPPARRSTNSSARKTRRSCRRTSRAYLSAQGRTARLDLGRLAGILPRSQRRRSARLGHRRHGGICHDPRLCPRPL